MSEKTTQKTAKNNAKLSQLMRFKQGFVKSADGTQIYYRTLGSGIPIVCCNGFGVPSMFWKYFEAFFQHHYQVVVWDYRGHGNSEIPKNIEHARMEDLIDDCQAVLKELKIKKAIFIGFSLGTQLIYEIYKQHPKQVLALIGCLGTYGKPLDTFYNSPFSKYLYEVLTLLGDLFPKQARWVSRALLTNPFWYQMGGLFKMIDTAMASKEDARKYVEHLLTLDPTFFKKMLESMKEHSSEETLKKIAVPTLIIGAEEDQFTPVWIARKKHRLILNSELLIVKKATHSALLERPELINLRIEKFLRERLEEKKKTKKVGSLGTQSSAPPRKKTGRGQKQHSQTIA